MGFRCWLFYLICLLILVYIGCGFLLSCLVVLCSCLFVNYGLICFVVFEIPAFLGCLYCLLGVVFCRSFLCIVLLKFAF